MSIIGKGWITWEEDECTVRKHSFVLEDFQTFEDIAAIVRENSSDLVHTTVELQLDADWVVDVSR